MINFTPPIKASLLISFVYIICFQLFLQSGNYVWLYPANVLFFVCSAVYIIFLNRRTNSTFNMLVLTSKGMKLSFISSLLSITGAAIIYVIDYYIVPEAKNSYPGFKGINEFVALLFANSMPHQIWAFPCFRKPWRFFNCRFDE